MTNIPDFSTEPERRQWFIDHADAFTTVRFVNNKYNKKVHPTLLDARLAARRMFDAEPGKPFLIYAVVGSSDSWVENVS